MIRLLSGVLEVAVLGIFFMLNALRQCDAS